MEQLLKDKKSYQETNVIARSPTLQTVLMVEKFIEENSGEYKKTDLFKNLPKKVMWQTFQVIMEYLENTYRIVYDKEGYIVYIWNPEFARKIKDRPEIKL
ncbi:MAG TPA: hypothetical protein P5277_04545 [Candidatus Paceibacterota bacterium]|nr:hypothetical protein [Candidatus Paceibacterota bacterium]